MPCHSGHSRMAFHLCEIACGPAGAKVEKRTCRTLCTNDLNCVSTRASPTQALEMKKRRRKNECQINKSSGSNSNSCKVESVCLPVSPPCVLFITDTLHCVPVSIELSVLSKLPRTMTQTEEKSERANTQVNYRDYANEQMKRGKIWSLVLNYTHSTRKPCHRSDIFWPVVNQ